MAKYMALDPGASRVGVAVSDPEGLLARPLGAIPRKPRKSFLEKISLLAKEHAPEIVVIGLPLLENGKSGPAAQRSMALAHDLRTVLGLKAELQDESYSTLEAEEILRENGASPAEIEKRADSVAAALILSRFMERKKIKSHPEGGDPPSAS
jgi:putative Holliday junction resolvase